MKRNVIDQLNQWRLSANRKPLILTGARQVGKTWALREFGRQYYNNVAYFNCEDNEQLRTIFDKTLSPSDLLPLLRAEAGMQIEPGQTLIIFDEVQTIPRILTALKYFDEQAPQYHIAVAGSTLGITLHEAVSFPVGKVDFMALHPMTFLEFLSAVSKGGIADFITNTNDLAKDSVFHDQLISLWRQYLYVGGMPAAVKEYATSGDYDAVRKLQNQILDAYRQDFSKHATPNVAMRLRLLWDAIPGQLAKENRRFIYSAVRSGARARDFEVAIQWLADSSLINKVNRVTAIKQPLKAYEDFGAFKLFIHDVGLLGAMAQTTAKSIVIDYDDYTEFKGSLAEQFVCQELIATGHTPFYWSSEDSKQEIDFLIDGPNGVVPIEVKAGSNLGAASFKKFVEREQPKLAYKLSALPYRDNGIVQNVPIYLTCKL